MIEPADTARQKIELRRLRQTVHELADAVEELAQQQEQQSSGDELPGQAEAAQKKVQSARKIAGSTVADRDEIRPPWERAGYENKEEWRTDQ